jgi:hypothetical protein
MGDHVRRGGVGALRALLVVVPFVVAIWLLARRAMAGGAIRRAPLVVAGIAVLAFIVVLVGGNPGQTARDVALRSATREVVFVSQAVDGHERLDVHVLRDGDQFTTVVVDRRRVINIRNDLILDRVECVPHRGRWELSVATLVIRSWDPTEGRTPFCDDVLQPLNPDNPRGAGR